MDDDALEALEIDLQIAGCGEILESFGIPPTSDLVIALWEWKETTAQTKGAPWDKQ